MNQLFSILLIDALLGENDLFALKKKGQPKQITWPLCRPILHVHLAQATATPFTNTHGTTCRRSYRMYIAVFRTLCSATSKRTSSVDIHQKVDNTGQKKEEYRPLPAPAPPTQEKNVMLWIAAKKWVTVLVKPCRRIHTPRILFRPLGRFTSIEQANKFGITDTAPAICSTPRRWDPRPPQQVRLLVLLG
jgi:hypothetical protein